jgi:hypothetical protein
MTESEWMAGTDPAPMLELVSGWSGERRPRLFACDCCRRLSYLFSDLDRAVVDAIERCAEGLISAKDIYTSAGVPQTGPAPYTFGQPHQVIREAASLVAWIGTRRARAFVVDVVRKAEGAAGRVAEWKRQSDIVRCIFGNPFREGRFLPEWRTDTVLVLAQQMYDSRDFSAMPILADALQDAGCDNEDVLTHCRGEGSHVRGCWVVDLCLGKE